MYRAEEDKVEEGKQCREACCYLEVRNSMNDRGEFQLTACDAYMTFHGGPYLGIHEIPGDILRSYVQLQDECESRDRHAEYTEQNLSRYPCA